MRILAIESSCDETAAAVVENGQKLLSSVVATSAEMHAKTGGIIPEQAARQQLVSIVPVIDETLKKARLTKNDIDALAVTAGPGLIGSLLVGVEAAKTLVYLWNKPLIPVNHLVGHIYANWINSNNKQFQTLKFPALALVVSGGHTDLVLLKGHGNIKWLGGTRDDAAGEAFDKTARLLDLPYPGGPSISKEAEKYLVKHPKAKLKLFPRPMLDSQDYDWSFSGLKTAVLKYVQENKRFDVSNVAAELQEAIVDVLVEKASRAVAQINPKSFLLAGGVAANKRLRDKFEVDFFLKKFSTTFHVPPINLCTDNAAYIASAAFYNFKKVKWTDVDARPELTITGQI
ncbi:tRNA (adenosine(37)-N6)-threonylcarbamoyltransferase complex transferase subunit TsaD [Candidatus Woesebacteria bacterium GWA1_41_8]|jgi:N6-L-threonylcarbamoyladenine synthase|uniref:tRNA N6-adenosine threonylcarbamoyltransferase n=1 Tax=Candidatus Woesebacteria bacterium GWA1_41_8 TaxID=1802471 RepID=A0A1F7WIE9_9BACT|nr:MAG: tRNA (adenosine(37)-N6)-threonylcarbamoyltransferase complex transferase subunit TsaD [Candidatus Woesebacteria bacterium GWA1_41_8]